MNDKSNSSPPLTSVAPSERAGNEPSHSIEDPADSTSLARWAFFSSERFQYSPSTENAAFGGVFAALTCCGLAWLNAQELSIAMNLSASFVGEEMIALLGALDQLS